MYSILNEIDKYVKENGIPFKDIIISPEYLPKHINQVILDKIREIRGTRYDFATSDYRISYDKFGHLYVMVHDILGRNNLCISNHRIDLDGEYFVSFISEEELIKEACMLKQMDQERKAIREMIHKTYKDISMIDKVKLENNIINTLAKDRLNKLDNNGSLLISSYMDELVKSTNLITNYIAYLNEFYMEELKQKEDAMKMDGILYTEPDSDTIGRNSTGNLYKGAHERVNDVMPAEDRISSLEGYSYIYREFAYSKHKDQIDYMSYLYQNNDKYILVMEPYNGIKHTKIVILNANREISKDEFKEMVRYYLELSYKETLAEKTVIRCYHTTIDKYINDLSYAITGENEQLIHPYFKGKVKTLKEQ